MSTRTAIAAALMIAATAGSAHADPGSRGHTVVFGGSVEAGRAFGIARGNGGVRESFSSDSADDDGTVPMSRGRKGLFHSGRVAPSVGADLNPASAEPARTHILPDAYVTNDCTANGFAKYTAPKLDAARAQAAALAAEVQACAADVYVLADEVGTPAAGKGKNKGKGRWAKHFARVVRHFAGRRFCPITTRERPVVVAPTDITCRTCASAAAEADSALFELGRAAEDCERARAELEALTATPAWSSFAFECHELDADAARTAADAALEDASLALATIDDAKAACSTAATKTACSRCRNVKAAPLCPSGAVAVREGKGELLRAALELGIDGSVKWNRGKLARALAIALSVYADRRVVHVVAPAAGNWTKRVVAVRSESLPADPSAPSVVIITYDSALAGTPLNTSDHALLSAYQNQFAVTLGRAGDATIPTFAGCTIPTWGADETTGSDDGTGGDDEDGGEDDDVILPSGSF